MDNVDAQEIRRFDDMAHRWWDPAGEFKPLHRINPVRLAWIKARANGVAGKKVLDVGCGGGILAEGLAREGATVSAIDLAEKTLAVAKLHLLESGLAVDYQCSTVEAFAAHSPAHFDVVTCMEMLEHVPDPERVIAACARLLKPDGLLCLSTINRTLKAGALLIGGAEYLLHMIPKGTHDFSRFIKPAELVRWLRKAGLAADDLSGLHYNAWSSEVRLCTNTDVNYLLSARHV